MSIPEARTVTFVAITKSERHLERAAAGGYLPRLVPLEAGELVHNAHHFSERANWLVPGKVLLGKYPGQIPADLTSGPERQRARDRILDIVLRGAVTDLFCLQAELPPQDDDSRWDPPADKQDDGKFFSGFRAYRDDAVAAVAAAATAAPATTVKGGLERPDGTAAAASAAGEPDVDGSGGESTAASDGVRREKLDTGAREGSSAIRSRGAEGLTFHYFPIIDLSPAENTEILAGLVDEMAALVASGKVPFIHCWAGRGRTGLLASCLLGKLYPELNAEQALNRVDAYYRTRGTVAIGKSTRVSPETPEQEDQVRLFFKQVLKR